MIRNGTYRAKATGECVLGTSKEKGTPFLEFYFKIIGGENDGGLVRTTLYFTENTNERTIESLFLCGWKGEDPSEFADGKLHGLDTNEVDIVVELETYQNDKGEDRVSPRVKWINRAGGYLSHDNAMNQAAAQTFGERMRGLVLAMKQKKGIPQTGNGTDFNFGANATPPPSAAVPTEPKKHF